MPCLVTVNDYTKDEDYHEAQLVLSCLGDPAGEQAIILQENEARRCYFRVMCRFLYYEH